VKLTDRQIKIIAIKADLLNFGKRVKRRNPRPNDVEMLRLLTVALADLGVEDGIETEQIGRDIVLAAAEIHNQAVEEAKRKREEWT